MENDQKSKNNARRRSTTVAHLLSGENRSAPAPHGTSPLSQSFGISDTENRGDQSQYYSGSGGESSSDWEMNDMHSNDDDNLEDDEETGLTSTDRKKRRRRKRKNTLLIERVAREDTTKSVEDEMAAKAFWKDATINATLIGLWYAFSISISVFNKWVLSKDNVDFHFPLFFTSCHMIIQFSLASLILYLIPAFRPKATDLMPEENHYAQVGQSEQGTNSNQTQKPVMTKMFYLTRIAPCGAATGLDIGLGNMSLMFISLTFYTMCKSSVLGFVLLFAFLFRLEKPSWRLAAVIVTMAIGVVLMVAGETAFSVLGFVLIMAASFFSGFRWSLTQILLLRNPATSNPFSSIFFLAPVMFVTLLIIAIPVEGPANFIAGVGRLMDARGAIPGIAILLFPGLLAFLMTASEFALLKRTSVVTLSVCGIFKEVLTISTGAIVFGDELTRVNLSGLLVTIAAIAAYNYMKIYKMREDAKKEAQQQIKAESPVLDTGERQKNSADREDDNNTRRASTHDLIRNTLSVQVNGLDRVRRSMGESERQSPVKRPEDVE